MNAKTYASLEGRVEAAEPPYQSDAEARIGDVLDRYDIPAFYRQARLIYDRGRHDIWRPTFTLPTYDSLVIEYADAAQGLDYDHQNGVYRANYIPAVFVRENDVAAPRLEENLIRAVQAEYNRARQQYRGAILHGFGPVDGGSS
ncbi:MAG: hypothetical protein AABZ47_18320 [Planctomycetota bacterium]